MGSTLSVEKENKEINLLTPEEIRRFKKFNGEFIQFDKKNINSDDPIGNHVENIKKEKEFFLKLIYERLFDELDKICDNITIEKVVEGLKKDSSYISCVNIEKNIYIPNFIGAYDEECKVYISKRVKEYIESVQKRKISCISVRVHHSEEYERLVISSVYIKFNETI